MMMMMTTDQEPSDYTNVAIDTNVYCDFAVSNGQNTLNDGTETTTTEQAYDDNADDNSVREIDVDHDSWMDDAMFYFNDDLAENESQIASRVNNFVTFCLSAKHEQRFLKCISDYLCDEQQIHQLSNECAFCTFVFNHTELERPRFNAIENRLHDFTLRMPLSREGVMMMWYYVRCTLRAIHREVLENVQLIDNIDPLSLFYHFFLRTCTNVYEMSLANSHTLTQLLHLQHALEQDSTDDDDEDDQDDSDDDNDDQYNDNEGDEESGDINGTQSLAPSVPSRNGKKRKRKETCVSEMQRHRHHKSRLRASKAAEQRQQTRRLRTQGATMLGFYKNLTGDLNKGGCYGFNHTKCTRCVYSASGTCEKALRDHDLACDARQYVHPKWVQQQTNVTLQSFYGPEGYMDYQPGIRYTTPLDSSAASGSIRSHAESARQQHDDGKTRSNSKNGGGGVGGGGGGRGCSDSNNKDGVSTYDRGLTKRKSKTTKRTTTNKTNDDNANTNHRPYTDRVHGSTSNSSTSNISGCFQSLFVYEGEMDALIDGNTCSDSERAVIEQRWYEKAQRRYSTNAQTILREIQTLHSLHTLCETHKQAFGTLSTAVGNDGCVWCCLNMSPSVKMILNELNCMARDKVTGRLPNTKGDRSGLILTGDEASRTVFTYGTAEECEEEKTHSTVQTSHDKRRKLRIDHNTLIKTAVNQHVRASRSFELAARPYGVEPLRSAIQEWSEEKFPFVSEWLNEQSVDFVGHYTSSLVPHFSIAGNMFCVCNNRRSFHDHDGYRESKYHLCLLPFLFSFARTLIKCDTVSTAGLTLPLKSVINRHMMNVYHEQPV